jgi:hypothetical protein
LSDPVSSRSICASNHHSSEIPGYNVGISFARSSTSSFSCFSVLYSPLPFFPGHISRNDNSEEYRLFIAWSAIVIEEAYQSLSGNGRRVDCTWLQTPSHDKIAYS